MKRTLINSEIDTYSFEGFQESISFKDEDTSREARGFRYKQYLSLKSLPFYTRSQAHRLNQLMRLRRRDNLLAMSEDVNRVID